MRLHILGPAFGLPSIDAECVAAVALVKTHCSRLSIDWEIVPDHRHEQELPRLVDDDAVHRGFDSIARHLNAYSELSAEDRANSAA